MHKSQSMENNSPRYEMPNEVERLKEERRKLLSLLTELEELIGEILDELLKEAENERRDDSDNSN